jgi:hypothetical protein
MMEGLAACFAGLADPREPRRCAHQLIDIPGFTHEIAAEAQPVSGSVLSLGKRVIFRALVVSNDYDDSDLLIL